jgi:hypothetical protein
MHVEEIEPLVRKRYKGPGPHQPANIPGRENADFVDDGSWNTDFQDFRTPRPPLSDFYLRFDPSYTFVEETLGQSINHWRGHLEAGYRLERVVARVFLMSKYGNGTEFPDDYPSRTDEMWYQHDRMIKHNHTNLGLGVLWGLSARTQLSAPALRTIDADHDYAFNLGVYRSF